MGQPPSYQRGRNGRILPSRPARTGDHNKIRVTIREEPWQLSGSTTTQQRSDASQDSKGIGGTVGGSDWFLRPFLLESRMLLDSLRQLHATTGTCYQGVLEDLESIEEELEEQERVKQESKPII